MIAGDFALGFDSLTLEELKKLMSATGIESEEELIGWSIGFIRQVIEEIQNNRIICSVDPENKIFYEMTSAPIEYMKSKLEEDRFATASQKDIYDD